TPRHRRMRAGTRSDRARVRRARVRVVAVRRLRAAVPLGGMDAQEAIGVAGVGRARHAVVALGGRGAALGDLRMRTGAGGARVLAVVEGAEVTVVAIGR